MMKKLKVSMHVITMNREAQMLRLLQSTRDLYDTIRVCDGGSTDNTVAICKAYGCKVFERPWDDDMSAQHNVLLDAAKKGEWINVWDDDEAPSPALRPRIRKYAEEGNLQGYEVVKIPSIMIIDGFGDWDVPALMAAIANGEQDDRFTKMILFKHDGDTFYSGESHYGLDWEWLQHKTVKDIIPEPYFHYKSPIDVVRCNIQQGFINPDMQGINDAFGRALRMSFAKLGVYDSLAMLDALDNGNIGDELPESFVNTRDPEFGTISDFYRYYFLFKHPEKLEPFFPQLGVFQDDLAMRRFLKEMGGYRSYTVNVIRDDKQISYLPIGHLNIHPRLKEYLGTNQILWDVRNRTPDA